MQQKISNSNSSPLWYLLFLLCYALHSSLLFLIHDKEVLWKIYPFFSFMPVHWASCCRLKYLLSTVSIHDVHRSKVSNQFQTVEKSSGETTVSFTTKREMNRLTSSYPFIFWLSIFSALWVTDVMLWWLQQLWVHQRSSYQNGYRDMRHCASLSTLRSGSWMDTTDSFFQKIPDKDTGKWKENYLSEI